MKLYLLHHGDCIDQEIDPERHLSEIGKTDLKNLAQFLLGLNLPIVNILHSSKLRSKQSAEVFAEALSFKGVLQERKGLEPMDDISEICMTLKDFKGDTLIVGHLPFLTKLVSQLVIDNENNAIVSFEPGTLVCLEDIRDKTWLITFMLKPSLF